MGSPMKDEQPISPTQEQFPLKLHEALNEFSEPLVSPDRKKEAMKYGYSFNSKKVAQGPTFFNLRLMCQYLGIAIKRHIDFSRNTYWFLDELNEVK